MLEKILNPHGKYAIYLRKSRADLEAELKGEGETLARHEKMLLELANKNNIKIEKIYKEIVSGETIDSRPEIKKLLLDVRNKKWEGVLVVEVERLARGETIDQGIIAKAFKISNTKIITPMKIYNPNDEFDEEYFEFGLFMSRREYKTINRRLQNGRIASVKEGKYVGSIPPFGYNKIKLKKDKGYTLKENFEANTVKLIFNLYAYENLSLNEIADKLNNLGLKPRKKDKWSYSSIKGILSNPIYVGKIRWNKRKAVKIYENDNIKTSRPLNRNYMIIEGLHKGIIDEKTWEIVQSKKVMRKLPVSRNLEFQNSLAGLVVCYKCGKKMRRRAYTKLSNISTLYCPNKSCNNIGIKSCIVENKILEGLRILLNDYTIKTEEIIKQINNLQEKSTKETKKTLEEELEKENKKLEKLYFFLEEGIYTKEVFQIRKSYILENIKSLEFSINKINEDKINKNKKKENKSESKNKKQNKDEDKFEDKIESKIEDNRELSRYIKEIKNIVDIYYFLKTPKEKNIFLKTFLAKVEYLKTRKCVGKNSDPTRFTLYLYPKIKNDNFFELTN